MITKIRICGEDHIAVVLHETLNIEWLMEARKQLEDLPEDVKRDEAYWTLSGLCDEINIEDEALWDERMKMVKRYYDDLPAMVINKGGVR